MSTMKKSGGTPSRSEPDERMTSAKRVTSTWWLLERYAKGDRDFFCDERAVVDLGGASLEGASLQHADLRHANFEGANLGGANLLRANLQHAKLQGAYLRRTNFQHAKLLGAKLQSATFHGADLQNADLRHSDLRGAKLQGAYLQNADLEGADLEGANLRRVNLTDANLQNANLMEADLRGALLHRTDFTDATLDVLLLTGGQIESAIGIDLPHAHEGLTLTFDTRLHRFDPTALDGFIAEVLSAETDVTIEERSNIDFDGPSFIRINGSNPEDLVAVAEAFYDRVWKGAASVVEEMAVEKAMSSGMNVLLQRLDSMRDSWTNAAINHADVKEMLLDQAADHMLAKDTPANLHGRLERITEGLAEHAKKKASKYIGTKTVEELGAASRETAQDARSWKDRRDVEKWEKRIAQAESAEPDGED